ncbi:MAG: hypothetical protein LUQ33_04795 [Methanoregulaceae archaeon]|nr:hypothetical protein [Methanoregulaceae archaeon]
MTADSFSIILLGLVNTGLLLLALGMHLKTKAIFAELEKIVINTGK